MFAVPITTLRKEDDMFANELVHTTVQPIQPALASLLIQGLGEPSFQSKWWATWNVRAFLEGWNVPFQVRIDHNGNPELIYRFADENIMMACVGCLLPTTIEITEIRPRGRNRPLAA